MIVKNYYRYRLAWNNYHLMHIRFLLSFNCYLQLQYTACMGHYTHARDNLLSEGVAKDTCKAGINHSSTCGLPLSSTSVDFVQLWESSQMDQYQLPFIIALLGMTFYSGNDHINYPGYVATKLALFPYHSVCYFLSGVPIRVCLSW